MTACSIITQGAAGYLITDTGWFHDDGRLALTRTKVVTAPGLPFAVAVRGSAIALGPAIVALAPTSVEQLMAALPELTANVIATAQCHLPAMTRPDDWSTSLYAVFWDARQGRAVGAFMANEAGDATPPGYRPWTWQFVQECLSPGIDLSAIYGTEPDTADPLAFPIEAGALAIIEAQRQERWNVNGGPLAHRVGGAAELTAVNAAGVTTRRIRSWADQVGRLI